MGLAHARSFAWRRFLRAGRTPHAAACFGAELRASDRQASPLGLLEFLDRPLEATNDLTLM